jgi:FKBP12-rapamycin complex-associated protein
MKSALEWLQGERNEIKRHAACLVLFQLAKNTPTLFYSYVPTFAELIWVALRDTKPTIRESAVVALGACLALISKREARVKQNWFQKIFEEALKVLAL